MPQFLKKEDTLVYDKELLKNFCSRHSSLGSIFSENRFLLSI